MSQDPLLGSWRDVAVSFIILDTFFVALRFVARRVVKHVAWGWDDTLVLAALVPNIAICALDLRNVALNDALEAAADAESQMAIVQRLRRIGWGTIICFPVAFTLPKLSILCMYLRVFTNDRRLRIAIYAVAAFCVLDCIAFLLLALLECAPIQLLWDPRYLSHPLPHQCIDVHMMDIAINPPNILSDLTILALPMRSIYKLRTTTARRVGIACTLALGCIGMFASAVRLSAYILSREHPESAYLGTLWDDMTVIEPSIYLIAACLPSLQAFIREPISKHSPIQFPRVGIRKGGRDGHPEQLKRMSMPRRADMSMRNEHSVSGHEHEEDVFGGRSSAGGASAESEARRPADEERGIGQAE